MRIHTVIESLAAYKAVRAVDQQGERVWWTTNAVVLETLSCQEESIFSLEQDLPHEDFDRLAQAGYAFTDRLREDLNRVFTWRGYADIGQALAFTVNECFFTTLYKGLLMGRLVLLAAKTGEYVECVGDPERVEQTGLTLKYGRFDTLYALLANACGLEQVTVFRHSLPAENLEKANREVVHRKMQGMEKLLSLLNNTPGSLLFKICKKLFAHSLFPFRQIRIWPLPRRRFYIYRSCELLDELFFELLRRGGSVGMLGCLPKVGLLADRPEALPDQDFIVDICRSRAMEALHEFGIMRHPLLDTCLDILIGRLLTSLGRLRASLTELTAGYEKVIARIGSNACILTSALSKVEEKLFYDFCHARGVKVVAIEHGITSGLSWWTDYSNKYYAMRHADIGMYHNALAAEQMGRIVPDQERIVAGLPQVTMGVGPRSLKRRIVRKWLGIRSDAHVVMYVAELAKNNFIYGPHADNDLQFVSKTEAMVKALCAAYPNSHVILKLYPTQRYVETHDFHKMTEELSNLHIIKDVDFRFIGVAADLIVTTSSQSTLGWVIGSGSPCLFGEFDWAPAHIDGLRMSFSEIPGLSALIAIDTTKFMMRMSPGCVSHLFHNFSVAEN